MPAFVTSELKTAFQIGFMILSLPDYRHGCGQRPDGDGDDISPMIISLPFKIMLFVMVDGWLLIMGTLAASFGL